MKNNAICVLAVSLLIAIGAALPTGAARAQQTDEGEAEGATESDERVERDREIEMEDAGATVRRPSGWVRSKSGKGALVTLRAAGDPNTQIEVRLSSPIVQKQRENFFGSFHANLKSAGFVQLERRAEQSHGAHTGEETEYKGSTSRGSFRLIVWQLYREGQAWLFVGFFPESRRDQYYEQFEALVASLRFDA